MINRKPGGEGGVGIFSTFFWATGDELLLIGEGTDKLLPRKQSMPTFVQRFNAVIEGEHIRRLAPFVWVRLSKVEIAREASHKLYAHN